MKEKVKRTTTETLEEIKHLPDLELEKDPEFIESYTRGRIVEDILWVLEKENISQVELAKRMGKSRKYISRVLNEKVNFSIETLAQFSSVLNCELSVSIRNKPEEI